MDDSLAEPMSSIPPRGSERVADVRFWREKADAEALAGCLENDVGGMMGGNEFELWVALPGRRMGGAGEWEAESENRERSIAGKPPLAARG